ncbi:MAG TPA: cation:proton antiporter [Steroidobacteraceae bacterium]|nr:cation:proton antiporter [Steroidobacteraceae bacterium]
MLLASRWRVSPALLALGLGLTLGRSGLALIQPQLSEDGGQVESVCEIALLSSLFCVSLRLQAPFQWSRWRAPLRLSTLSLLSAWALAAAAAKALFDVSLLQALLLASVLAPTDAVLAADAAGGMTEGSDAESPAANVLAAEGAFSSALAVPAVIAVLGLMGLESRDSSSVGWLGLLALWSVAGGAAAGAAIGAGMSRWIALLDFDRQSDVLELLVVFTTGALAYGAAEAIHTNGFLAVIAAGLALSHGGRWRSKRRKRALAPRVLKIAARIERAAALGVVVLVGAMSPEMDFHFRVLAFAAIVLALIRPIAVRLGLGASALACRKQLEWVGVRGAASVYCLAFAMNHGLGARFGHELAGITLLVVAGSILAHGLSASPLHTASPGALSS